MASKEAATRRLLFTCTAALLVVCHTLADSPQCESGSLRLPKRVKPTHYDVKLSLDWEIFKYKGRVAIDIEFDRDAAERDLVCKYIGTPSPSCDTKKIILHAGKELEIETVELSKGRNSLSSTPEPKTGPETVVNFCRDSSNDQLIVELDRDFNSAGQLVITYTGQLRKETHKGFFLSEENDSQGEYTPFWVTSLEPGWARTVFACFDEPEFKATFKVTVEHPQGLTALSNMHEIRRAESNGRTEVQFEQTPKMSTYLFAVAIGKMDHIATSLPNGKITFRAWAPPGRAEEARESLDLIVKSYESFVKFFNVEQPLKKIDFVPISRSYGGMENWGLVTIQTRAFLDGDEMRQTLFFVRSVHASKNIILHEMAHFWFGNLVTMKWWDDLWLSEGFATLMASIETNRMFPELGGKHFDLIYEQSQALNTMTEFRFDHPIKQLSLQSIDDIIKSFNYITYKKASAVLRMTRNYIGDESFQTGVQKYIKKFMYKNAEAENLWDALNEASGKNVGEIMNSWISLEGFPLVEASFEENRLSLSQRKFPLSKEEPDNKKRWKIPISFLVSDGQEKSVQMQFLLTSGQAQITLPRWFKAGEAGHFVKVNKDFEGLYRVFYHDDMIQALKKPIEDKKILSDVDRMNLLDDYLAFHKADLVNRDQLRDLTSWFKGEKAELVLMSLMSILDTYRPKDIGQNEEGLAILKDYFHNKLESTLNVPEEELFKNKENLLQTMVRNQVIFSLVRFSYEPALNFSLEYFRSRQGKVAHHMIKPIYSGVALAGTDEEFEQIKQLVDELAGEPRIGLIEALRWVLQSKFRRYVQLKGMKT